MFYASDTAGFFVLFFFKLKIVNIFDRGGRIECSLSEEQSDTDKQAPLLTDTKFILHRQSDHKEGLFSDQRTMRESTLARISPVK